VNDRESSVGRIWLDVCKLLDDRLPTRHVRMSRSRRDTRHWNIGTCVDRAP
jgi:hypothetical protein